MRQGDAVDGTDGQDKATFNFGGWGGGELKDYLSRDDQGRVPDQSGCLQRRVGKVGKHGGAQKFGRWPGPPTPTDFLNSYCKHHSDTRRRHPRAACDTALLRGLKDHAERAAQGKARPRHQRRRVVGAVCMTVGVSPRARVPGPDKTTRHAEASASSECAQGFRSIIGCRQSAAGQQAADFVVDRAKSASAAARKRDISPKGRGRGSSAEGQDSQLFFFLFFLYTPQRPGPGLGKSSSRGDSAGGSANRRATARRRRCAVRAKSSTGNPRQGHAVAERAEVLRTWGRAARARHRATLPRDELR